MSTKGLTERMWLMADPIMVSAPFLLLVSMYFASAWPEDHLLLEFVEEFGVVLLVVAILGRCWAILASQASSNQVPSIQGPYRFTAHPMLFFGTLALTAIGFITGSLVLAAVFFVFGFVISRITINKRDSHPDTRHDETSLYRKIVPDFFPALSPRVTADEARDHLVYSQSILLRCVGDALFFLMLIPLAEGVDWVRDSGYLIGHIAIY